MKKHKSRSSSKAVANKANGTQPLKLAEDDAPCDDWGNVWRGYRRTLFLGAFADAGRPPRMSDAEVAVCFADLRGFTNYVHLLQRDGQDNKVRHFLTDYFQIYTESVLHAIWSIEPNKDNKQMTEEDAELKRLMVPASYKNLGDGMMIVWELQSASSMKVQGLATRSIYSIVEQFQKGFTELVSNFGPVETDSYSTHAANLKLGFGLARGHAWRLDFGNHVPIDYAGSIINMAARLQDLARPHGIVAQLGFSESLFNTFVSEKKGRIAKIDSPKGFGKEPVDVWISDEVQIAPTLAITVQGGRKSKPQKLTKEDRAIKKPRTFLNRIEGRK